MPNPQELCTFGFWNQF